MADSRRALTHETLNADVACVISKWLSNKELANLTLVSKGTNQLFKPIRTTRTIPQLLHAVAYANPAAVEAMLAANPELVLRRGDTEVPSGDTIFGVTAYECALGAGDDDMAARIATYFAELPEGEENRVIQYNRYKPHIDGMLTQPAYDFSALLQIIKDSSPADVTAALDLHFDDAIRLHAALAEFRQHFAPRQIKEGMHFNYANLREAFKVHDAEFDNLSRKCDLFWRQVIGYIQRGLPACDRQAFAQGIYYIVGHGEKLQRHFNFRFGGGSFPVTAGDQAISGLGYSWAAARYAGGRCDAGRGGMAASLFFGKFMSNKNIKLAELYAALAPTTRAARR